MAFTCVGSPSQTPPGLQFEGLGEPLQGSPCKMTVTPAPSPGQNTKHLSFPLPPLSTHSKSPGNRKGPNAGLRQTALLSFIVPGKVSDNRGLPREAKAHVTLTKFNKARPADSTSCLRGAWRFKA